MSDCFRGETIGFDEFLWESITINKSQKYNQSQDCQVSLILITSAIIFAP